MLVVRMVCQGTGPCGGELGATKMASMHPGQYHEGDAICGRTQQQKTWRKFNWFADICEEIS